MLLKKDFLVNVAILLSFYPSTLFFIFPNNQIQPLYVIPCGILMLGSGIRYIPTILLPVLILLLVTFCYFVSSLIFADDQFLSLFVNYLSYVSPLVLFITLVCNRAKVRCGMVLLTLILWTLVSIHQKFAPVNPIGNFVEEVLRHFIADRFSMYKSIESAGRGASGLTAEPAGAAIICMQFIFFYRYFTVEYNFKTRKKLLWLSLITALVLCNTSGTLAILLGVLITGLFVTSVEKFRAISVTFVTLILIYALYSVGALGRVGRIVDEVLDNLDWLLDVNIFYALTFFMGLRVYNWIYSYGSLSNNYGLGHLVAGWNNEEVMLTVIRKIGWYPTDFAPYTNITYNGILIKPWSYASIVTFDFGMLGLACILALIWAVLRRVNKFFLGDVLVGFVIIMFFPPVTMGVPWIIFALSRRSRFGTNLS